MVERNDEGYLQDYQAWSRDFAELVAAEMAMILDDFDWQVLQFAHDFYVEHQLMPLSRLIVKHIKAVLDPDFDSLKLQQRYTNKPLRVIAKLAGLPKPIQCI